MSTTADPQQDPPPWWTSFPSPAATPNSISLQDMCALVCAYLSRCPSSRPAPPPSKDWLLVDVRRTDFEGGTIATSVNFPAQSLYHTRRAVWDVCRAGGVRKVVFFCGASQGRGPRCAGWMQDYINEVGAQDEMEALVLKGGVKGWVKEFGGELMDFYEPAYWERFK